MASGIHDTNVVKKIIGARLTAARIKAGYSRQKAVDEIEASSLAPVFEKHPTLEIGRYKKWEYGENPIEIEWLPAICKVYNCDVGYLFGEYEEYTMDRQTIRDKTKLSESAIDWLLKNKVENPHLINALNELFEYDGIADALFSAIFNFALSHFSSIVVSDVLHDTDKRLSSGESKQVLKFSVQECFSDVLDCIWEKNQPVSQAMASMKINKYMQEIEAQKRDKSGTTPGEVPL